MKGSAQDEYSPVFSNDYAYEFDLSSNTDSLYCDKRYNVNAKKQIFKNIEFTNLKAVHNAAFIFFLIAFVGSCVIFFPNLLNDQSLNKMVLSKKEHFYFSNAFALLPSLVKLMALASYVYFFIMVFFLTASIRQRCSVPELENQKYKNWLSVFSCFSSLACLASVLFYQQPLLAFSQQYLGLVENACFSLFLVNSYIFSFTSYSTLVEIKQTCNKPDEVKILYFNTKQFVLVLQTLVLCLYLLCEILVSLYNPVSRTEMLMLGVLMEVLSINSVLYISLFLIYVMTLSFDYNFVNLHLQVLPDVEYFVDSEQPSKLDF